MIIYRIFLPLVAATAIPFASAAEHTGPPGPPPPPPAEELFKTFDTNNDGVLSRDEFKKGMEELAKHRHPPGDRPQPPGDREPPPRPDADGNNPPPPPPPGADQRHGERKPPADGAAPAGNDGPPPRPADIEQRLDAAFTKADADNSGTLTLAEFKNALAALPPPPRPPRPPQHDQ